MRIMRFFDINTSTCNEQQACNLNISLNDHVENGKNERSIHSTTDAGLRSRSVLEWILDKLGFFPGGRAGKRRLRVRDGHTFYIHTCISARWGQWPHERYRSFRQQTELTCKSTRARPTGQHLDSTEKARYVLKSTPPGAPGVAAFAPAIVGESERAGGLIDNLGFDGDNTGEA